MIKRTSILALAFVLPTCAEASEFFPPSGPFARMAAQRPACATQQPTPGQEFGCVPLRPSSVEHVDEVRHALDRAEGFVFHGRQDLATDELNAALARAPGSAVLWHFSARLKLNSGDIAEARVDLKKSLGLDSENGDALATEAYLVSLTGDPRTALQAYQHALTRAPDNEFALVSSVYLSEQLKEFTVTEAALNKLGERWPDNPVVIGHAIDRDMQLGNFRSALARSDAAARNGSNHYGDRVRRVTILQAVGDHDRAVSELNDLIGADGTTLRFAMNSPTRAKLRFTRALSYKELRRFDDARRDVSAALRDADQRFLLRISVYLVSNGFEDLEVVGTLSKELENSAVACILNVACGLGLTRKI